MANEEHFAILKKGVEVWNQWRKEHPNVQIDLDGVDLRGCTLNQIDLSGSNLRNATFWQVDFHGANLARADFSDLALVN